VVRLIALGVLTVNETATTDAPDARPPEAPAPSIRRDIRSGLLGVGIAILCLIPPGIHFVSGPLGPGIGGFFAATRVHARGKHIASIALTLAVGEAIIAWIVAGILMVIGTIGKDSATLLFVAVVDVAVFFYSFCLAGAGAFLGGLSGGG